MSFEGGNTFQPYLLKIISWSEVESFVFCTESSHSAGVEHYQLHAFEEVITLNLLEFSTESIQPCHLYLQPIISLLLMTVLFAYNLIFLPLLFLQSEEYVDFSSFSAKTNCPKYSFRNLLLKSSIIVCRYRYLLYSESASTLSMSTTSVFTRSLKKP